MVLVLRSLLQKSKILLHKFMWVLKDYGVSSFDCDNCYLVTTSSAIKTNIIFPIDVYQFTRVNTSLYAAKIIK